MSFDYFASPGAEEAKQLVKDAFDTLVAEYPNRDPKGLWQFVAAEFQALQRLNSAVTAGAIVRQYRKQG